MKYLEKRKSHRRRRFSNQAGTFSGSAAKIFLPSVISAIRLLTSKEFIKNIGSFCLSRCGFSAEVKSFF